MTVKPSDRVPLFVQTGRFGTEGVLHITDYEEKKHTIKPLSENDFEWCNPDCLGSQKALDDEVAYVSEKRIKELVSEYRKRLIRDIEINDVPNRLLPLEILYELFGPLVPCNHDIDWACGLGVFGKCRKCGVKFKSNMEPLVPK